MFSACVELDVNEPVDNGNVNGEGTVPAGFPKVIYASMADETAQDDTRTYVDGQNVLWHKGDEIAYHGGEYRYLKYVNNGDDDASSAKLDYVEGTGNTTTGTSYVYNLYAVYPYSASKGCETVNDREQVYVNYPSSQIYIDDSFGRGANIMVASFADSDNISYSESEEDYRLYFRNACGYFILKLYGPSITKIKSIVLKSNNNNKIAGDGTILFDSGIPYTTMSDDASDTVTLDCSNGGQGVVISSDSNNPTEFWFALPPVVFDQGLEIVVTDVHDIEYTKKTTKSITIARNKPQPMAAISVGLDAPASNQIWYTQVEGTSEPCTFGTETPFNSPISKHFYNEDKGVFVIECKEPITVIKEKAFFKNMTILDVTLPNGLQKIESDVFAGTYSYERIASTSLRSINIPGTVTTIEDDAFLYNYSLKDLKFEPSPTTPATPLTIGDANGSGPFADADLDLLDVNRDFIYSHKPDATKEGIFSWSGANELIIGEQLTEIYDYMFTSLRIQGSFEIPSHIQRIGHYAFYDGDFTELTIPENVTSIGNNAFDMCENLQELNIEDSNSTLYIGKTDSWHSSSFFKIEVGPFYSSPLENIYIGRNVEYLNEFVPDETDEGIFASYKVEDTDFTTKVTIGSYVTNLSYRMFNDCPFESITIPGTVTSVGENVFDGSRLKSITFEAGTSDLSVNDDSPFSYCPLESVELNRVVRNESIFTNLSSLTSVTIGEKITTIYPHMFNSTGLRSITIPSNVTNIGNNAFQYCEKLNTVNIEESDEPLTIGYIGVYAIGSLGSDYGPFYDSPLSSISLNRKLNYVDKDGNPFTADDWDEGIFANKHYAEENLTTDITIGSKVTEISDYMFSGVRVSMLTLPANVSSIGKYAFYDCRNLYHVFCQRSEPPTIGENVFYKCQNMTGQCIKVPTNSLNAYKEATNWSVYADKMYTSGLSPL